MTVLQTSWSHGMGGGGKIFHEKGKHETSCKTEEGPAQTS